MRVFVLLCLAAMAWVSCGPARAGDGSLCRAATAAVEAELRIPDAFLSAIARVESGRPDNLTGTVQPWPWTVNAEGQGAFYATKQEAIAAVLALQARGVRSIDVGCMQVNLMHHPDAFASLQQAFDPPSNAAYAGHFLLQLFAQTGSWPHAAAAYHSQTPTVGAAYQQRVLAEWSQSDRQGARATPPLAPMPPPLSGHGSPAPRATRLLAGAFPAMGRVTAFAGRAMPAAAGALSTGRGLAAYRAMPTMLALRWSPRPG